MNPQQRIAALGTDKELSDLLDFSAVGWLFSLFFLLFTFWCHAALRAFRGVRNKLAKHD